MILQWLAAQADQVKAAIINCIGGIWGNIITGIFSLLGKKDKSKTAPTYTINQTATGNNNTQIGIQNNFKKDE